MSQIEQPERVVARSSPSESHADSAQPSARSSDQSGGEPLRLHIGGQEPKDGWKILNVQPGPHVDFVGNCTNLSQFADGSVAEVYASHVLEHLDYMHELGPTLTDIHRIVAPGGRLLISVPDLDMLCTLFVHPDVSPKERHGIMRMMFGGQIDSFDYHKVGFNWDILTGYLNVAGFEKAIQVDTFDLFGDCSGLIFRGNHISLNVIAYR